MPEVAHIGSAFDCGDTVAAASGDVFVNNLPVARLGDLTMGHSASGHTLYPPVPIVDGAGSVFANNLPVATAGSKLAVHCDLPPHPSSDCHDGAITVPTSSADVFAE